MRILEVGCGDGTLWLQNRENLPADVEILLSDISEGMLRDARRALGTEDKRFDFQVMDCQQILCPDESFDLVIAGHVLFYCEDPGKAVCEIRRVLKPGGKLVCSTYGNDHMKEVSELVQDFDEHIVLSADKLYERFGRENGRDILKPCFTDVEWRTYEDCLIVPDPEPLISYILSCHGNQGQYIPERYREFFAYVKKRTNGGLRITKDAGVFIGYC